MKLWKLSLTAAAVAFVVATSTVARATPFVLDGTYVFTSSDPLKTSYDGSWVKFTNDVITDWYLFDTHADDAHGYPPNNLPLTPGNSHHDAADIAAGYSGVFGPDAWQFKIVGDADPSIYYYDFFKGWNNLNGTSALYDGFNDPLGTWTFRVSSVPETSGTLQLLVGALIALGACKYFWFGRAASRS